MGLNTEPAYTFDDVLVLPGHTDFERHDIDTSIQIAPGLELGVPFISAPMDTVTDSRLAITLRQLGGLGIIHRNLTVADQVAEVRAVKEQGLEVGAAISTRQGYYEERVRQLVDTGVDMLVTDKAHGDDDLVLGAIEKIKKIFDGPIMSGNIATSDSARRSIDAGASILRVGMGPGSICTTRGVSGMGVPQLTAVMETSEVANAEGVTVVADGGIGSSDDIVKAIAGGAGAVMMGRIWAQTTEAPSRLIELEAHEVPSRFKSIINGAKTYEFKVYRGMGSKGAWEDGLEVMADEEYHGKVFNKDSTFVPEGVEGLVSHSGPLKKTVDELREGLVSGMYYTGSRTIAELRDSTEMRIVTEAARVESRPHDIFVIGK